MRKWSSVTADRVLNDAVMPPYTWLLYAVRDRDRLARGPRLESLLPDGDLRAAAERYFHDPTPHDDLDAFFARHAAGPPGAPPRHRCGRRG